MGLKRITELIVISTAAAVITARCVSTALSCHLSLSAFALAAVGVTCGLMSVLILDMCRYQPADSAPFSLLLGQHILITSPLAKLLCWVGHNKLHLILNDCKGTQDETLAWIVSENGNTVYGRDHNISSIRSREDLVSMQPLSTYAHYEKYSERTATGEKNVMTKVDVTIMAVSSGTTGKSKKYPYTVGVDCQHMGISILGFCYHYLQEIRKIGLKRVFQFRSFQPRRTNMYGMEEGGVGSVASRPNSGNVVPKCFLKTAIEPVSFYIQSVFSLAEREVGYLDGYSSDLWYCFFKFMVEYRTEICDSIESGVLKEFKGMSEDLRGECDQHLIANKTRADELRGILSGPPRGMLRKIWPGVELMTCAKSGGFAHSAQLLKNTFAHGLNMRYFHHMATEGLVGLMYNDHVDSDIFTLCCKSVFMEFIPIEHIDQEEPKTLFVDQLEVGGVYEVVLTNIYGLYRNRFGDVIEIVGFAGNTPKYKFLYRTGQILNIAFDRTPEKIFFDALSQTELSWKNTEVVSYTTTESIHLEMIVDCLPFPAFYVTFIEVISLQDGKLAPLKKPAEIQLDANLCKLHSNYKEYRVIGGVGPVRIVQVMPGTFQNLRHLLGRGRMNHQFKMPRVLRTEAALRLLWGSRVADL